MSTENMKTRAVTIRIVFTQESVLKNEECLQGGLSNYFRLFIDFISVVIYLLLNSFLESYHF